jgi:hypothetical protein
MVGVSVGQMGCLDAFGGYFRRWDHFKRAE